MHSPEVAATFKVHTIPSTLIDAEVKLGGSTRASVSTGIRLKIAWLLRSRYIGCQWLCSPAPLYLSLAASRSLELWARIPRGLLCVTLPREWEKHRDRDIYREVTKPSSKPVQHTQGCGDSYTHWEGCQCDRLHTCTTTPTNSTTCFPLRWWTYRGLIKCPRDNEGEREREREG